MSDTIQTPLPASHGYFGPDSMSWRLYREPLVLVGGFRALLLQIAHPAVAEGVAKYSNFQTDALGRGFRTFKAMATIYFGDQQAANIVASHLKKIHGHMPLTHAPTLSSTDPTAANGNLQLWVWATLIDTTLVVFTPAAKSLRLPEDWQEQFYKESIVAAEILGIPNDLIPSSLTAFQVYFSAILHSDLLGSSPQSANLTQAIVGHRLVIPPLGRFLALGWLPDPLCARIHIPVGAKSRRRFSRLIRIAYTLYRLWPAPLRYSPAYHQAHDRINRSNGKRTALMGRFYRFLARYIAIPLGLPV